jgi:hypothetical protein
MNVSMIKIVRNSGPSELTLLTACSSNYEIQIFELGRFTFFLTSSPNFSFLRLLHNV